MSDLEENKFVIRNGPPTASGQPTKSSASGEDFLQTNTSTEAAYGAGRLSYSQTELTILADTGFANVRNAIGQEDHTLVYNDTGLQIDNGKVCNASGIDSTEQAFTVILADASSAALSSAVIGVTTMNIPDGEFGMVTKRGDVNDAVTTGLNLGGIAYLSDTSAGDLTNTKPLYPSTVLIVGSIKKVDATEGRIGVDVTRFQRYTANQSYSFTSQGVNAGTYYKAGFYDFASSDTTLTQASLTQTYGTSGLAYAAHPAIVASAAGVVDTGQVALRVSGIQDNEEGTQAASQTDIVTEDITTLTANEYKEAVGKFSGQITFELYVVSGSPAAYSLTFNYGYAKYEDFGNRDITIDYFDFIWRGAGNDTGFDVALLHHKKTGWTYAASGFVAGNGDICRKSIDQAIAGNVGNGSDGAYKRVNLMTSVEGSGSEGIIIEITTGINNSIQTSDSHILAYSEELTR